jgi:predicted nucleotidyltransferase
MRTWDNIPLLGRERQAIKEAVKMLKTQFPVSNVILFGSKVRGEDDEHSDIDFLLVTSRALDWKEEKVVVEILFDIGIAHDVIFSPLFASSDEWDGGIFVQFPVYEEISRDGAIIP